MHGEELDTAGPPRLHTVPRGAVIYRPGEAGVTWRLLSGQVRLDREDGETLQFASLALPGDLLGSEVLLHPHYLFRATTLTPCRIEPWLQPAGEALPQVLAGMLSSLQRRAADLMALRTGEPLERVRRLLRLLAEGDGNDGVESARIALPRLSDMADMTDLAAETVSRAISRLGRAGAVSREGQRRARVQPGRLVAAPPAHSPEHA